VGPSADSYDALSAGKARGVDVVIVDTAGRPTLRPAHDRARQDAAPLLKVSPSAPHQTFLVMDATTGRTECTSPSLYRAANVTGIVLHELDGTAKWHRHRYRCELETPRRLLAVSRKMEDIIPFDTNGLRRLAAWR